MAQNEKIIGYSLIAFAAVLFVVLIFIKIQVDKESAYLCEKFHENKLDMSACPVHQANSFSSNLSWMITTAFGISFLIFAAGVYIAFFHRLLTREPKKEFKDVDLSRLGGDEKRIYEIIKSKSGSAYQSDLIKETGLSKVKVTRVLDRLEAKDVLEKKRRGMTNIIVLK